MLLLDDRQIRKLATRLRSEAPQALKYAVRDTLNTAAFETRKHWQGQMQTTFTLRNRWIPGSIRVEKVSGLDVRTMESRVGSLFGPLKVQEDSGTIQGRGKEGYRRPTKRAKPQGRVTRQAVRMARLSLTHPKLDVPNPSKSKPIAQKIMVAARMARAAGYRYVFLELSEQSRGIYQLMGSKRRPKLRTIWDMRHGSVHIPKHATLEPAYKRTVRTMPRFGEAALLRQLKRRRLA